MDKHSDSRFDWIVGTRQEKPRDSGLTMVLGDGPFTIGGLRGIRDFVEVVGNWVDRYKFIRSSFPLQPPAIVEKKIELLEKHNIVGFVGGNFLEAAVLAGDPDRMLDDLVESGCPGVEVSSTSIDLELGEKIRLIESAADRGLHVHAEIGKKPSETGDGTLPTSQVITEMEACLEAGAEVVILEMEEIMETNDRGEVLSQIVETIDYRDIMFELPVSTYHDAMSTSQWFMDFLGVDVNLGNVNPNHVILIEQQRRGIGPYSFDG